MATSVLAPSTMVRRLMLATRATITRCAWATPGSRFQPSNPSGAAAPRQADAAAATTTTEKKQIQRGNKPCMENSRVPPSPYPLPHDGGEGRVRGLVMKDN